MSLVSRDPELTIRPRSSTVERIKQVSWDTMKKKYNYTYDQIILHLIDSFFNNVK